jgi:hypothetical protein
VDILSESFWGISSRLRIEVLSLEAEADLEAGLSSWRVPQDWHWGQRPSWTGDVYPQPEQT